MRTWPNTTGIRVRGGWIRQSPVARGRLRSTANWRRFTSRWAAFKPIPASSTSPSRSFNARALELDPRSSEALLGLASVYERQGRATEAAKTYERGTALRPDYWEGYNRLGDFYIRQSRPADAEAQFKRAVELTPDGWVGYLNLGVALQLQNKYDESARALEKSIQLSPSYAAYSNLGNIYYRQMKPAQAAPLFEKAVAINGSDFRAWFNYALANRWLEIQGDKAAGERAKTGYKRSQEILQARLVREPNNADVHERLAMIFSFFRQREEALRHLESARILDSKPDSFESVRAEVLELLGDRKQAIAALESALKHGSQFEATKRNPEIQGVLTDPNFEIPTLTASRSNRCQRSLYTRTANLRQAS